MFNYRGFTLNEPGTQAPWGKIEFDLFKSIIDTVLDTTQTWSTVYEGPWIDSIPSENLMTYGVTQNNKPLGSVIVRVTTSEGEFIGVCNPSYAFDKFGTIPFDDESNTLLSTTFDVTGTNRIEAFGYSKHTIDENNNPVYLVLAKAGAFSEDIKIEVLSSKDILFTTVLPPAEYGAGSVIGVRGNTEFKPASFYSLNQVVGTTDRIFNGNAEVVVNIDETITIKPADALLSTKFVDGSVIKTENDNNTTDMYITNDENPSCPNGGSALWVTSNNAQLRRGVNGLNSINARDNQVDMYVGGVIRFDLDSTASTVKSPDEGSRMELENGASFLSSGTSDIRIDKNSTINLLPTPGTKIKVADDVIISPVTDDGTKELIITNSDIIGNDGESVQILNNIVRLRSTDGASNDGALDVNNGEVKAYVNGSGGLVVNSSSSSLNSSDNTANIFVQNGYSNIKIGSDSNRMLVDTVRSQFANPGVTNTLGIDADGCYANNTNSEYASAATNYIVNKEILQSQISSSIDNVCSSLTEMQILINAGYTEVYYTPSGGLFQGTLTIPEGVDFRIKTNVNDGVVMTGDVNIVFVSGLGYVGTLIIDSIDLGGHTLYLDERVGGGGPPAEIYNVRNSGKIATYNYTTTPSSVYIGKITGAQLTVENINVWYEEAENGVAKIGTDSLEKEYWRTPTTLNNVCSNAEEAQILIDGGYKEIFMTGDGTLNGTLTIPFGVNIRFHTSSTVGIVTGGDLSIVLGAGTGYFGSLEFDFLRLDDNKLTVDSQYQSLRIKRLAVSNGASIDSSNDGGFVWVNTIEGPPNLTVTNLILTYEYSPFIPTVVGTGEAVREFWWTPTQDLTNLLSIGPNPGDAGGQDVVNVTNIEINNTLPFLKTVGSSAGVFGNKIQTGSLGAGTDVVDMTYNSSTGDFKLGGVQSYVLTKIYSKNILAIDISTGDTPTLPNTDNTKIDATGNKAIITKEYADANYSGVSSDVAIVTWGDIDFYNANDEMAYSTQSGSASALRQYVAMRSENITAISWEMGTSPVTAGRHQVSINGGTWTDLQVSDSGAVTGFYVLASSISLSAGDAIKIRYTQSHADSHTVSLELTRN